MLIAIIAGSSLVVLFGIAGVWMVYKYFQEQKNADKSQGWSSTFGKITKASLDKEASFESGNTLYYPEVEYTYEFLGTEYTGYKISFGGSSGNSNRKKSEETLAKYPVGKEIPVFYDPNNPKDSVLIRNIGTGGKVFLFVGILFVFVSICTTLVGLFFAWLSFMGS
ncbi:MAG: DUF3592 domain-containing protein [Chloroflexi bacterium]|nr:DUF3592 domain-containing protein [Chloroflexota bacterium]